MICVCLHVTRGRLNSSASSAPSLGRSAMQWPNLMHNILSPIYTCHTTDRKTKSFYPTECKWNESTQRQPWGAFHVRFQISLFTQRRKKRADWGDIKMNLIIPLSFLIYLISLPISMFEKVVALWSSNNWSFPRFLMCFQCGFIHLWHYIFFLYAWLYTQGSLYHFTKIY